MRSLHKATINARSPRIILFIFSTIINGVSSVLWSSYCQFITLRLAKYHPETIIFISINKTLFQTLSVRSLNPWSIRVYRRFNKILLYGNSDDFLSISSQTLRSSRTCYTVLSQVWRIYRTGYTILSQIPRFLRTYGQIWRPALVLFLFESSHIRLEYFRQIRSSRACFTVLSQMWRSSRTSHFLFESNMNAITHTFNHFESNKVITHILYHLK